MLIEMHFNPCCCADMVFVEMLLYAAVYRCPNGLFVDEDMFKCIFPSFLICGGGMFCPETPNYRSVT